MESTRENEKFISYEGRMLTQWKEVRHGGHASNSSGEMNSWGKSPDWLGWSGWEQGGDFERTVRGDGVRRWDRGSF